MRHGKKNVANQIDVHVGRRVRLRRMLKGISQEKLGERLGLTFQQIQKYERGVNRIGASRLFEMSRILDVPIGYFFEDMPTETAVSVMGEEAVSGAEDRRPGALDADVLLSKETTSLLRAYHLIEDPEVRRRALDLLRSLAPKAEPD
jgi:transcriptional regulator with XRE-family HTH domain